MIKKTIDINYESYRIIAIYSIKKYSESLIFYFFNEIIVIINQILPNNIEYEAYFPEDNRLYFNFTLLISRNLKLIYNKMKVQYVSTFPKFCFI